ncbi:hypothetical protein VNI00_017999 [Paramarasmius palmivorus]|uniref:Uncharacterized protein n=1 Tax=Paramarasmius palmivorus TaxID=297713 RepID=A0AAW0B1Y7_9AGAR
MFNGSRRLQIRGNAMYNVEGDTRSMGIMFNNSTIRHAIIHIHDQDSTGYSYDDPIDLSESDDDDGIQNTESESASLPNPEQTVIDCDPKDSEAQKQNKKQPKKRRRWQGTRETNNFTVSGQSTLYHRDSKHDHSVRHPSRPSIDEPDGLSTVDSIRIPTDVESEPAPSYENNAFSRQERCSDTSTSSQAWSEELEHLENDLSVLEEKYAELGRALQDLTQAVVRQGSDKHRHSNRMAGAAWKRRKKSNLPRTVVNGRTHSAVDLEHLATLIRKVTSTTTQMKETGNQMQGTVDKIERLKLRESEAYLQLADSNAVVTEGELLVQETSVEISCSVSADLSQESQPLSLSQLQTSRRVRIRVLPGDKENIDDLQRTVASQPTTPGQKIPDSYRGLHLRV